MFWKLRSLTVVAIARARLMSRSETLPDVGRLRVVLNRCLILFLVPVLATCLSNAAAAARRPLATPGHSGGGTGRVDGVDGAATGSGAGSGLVFMVNPVQSSGDQTLTDLDDAAGAVPASGYVRVPLRNLDGSGFLRGAWVSVRSGDGLPARSVSGVYDYDRSQGQFEQVMAYFWVTRAQEYLQSLGFGSRLPGILRFPLRVNVNQGDQTYTDPLRPLIVLGTSGVDAAEDAEVIIHEYGHAVLGDQVGQYSASRDFSAIDEAFADYLGVSVGLAAARRYRWPVRTERVCFADWFSTPASPTPPHCRRRFDTGLTVADRTGEPHYDGQIWSQALWEIRRAYARVGLSSRRWDTTLVASQFHYANDTSFSAAAKATYTIARARDGSAAKLVKRAFAARGITF